MRGKFVILLLNFCDSEDLKGIGIRFLAVSGDSLHSSFINDNNQFPLSFACGRVRHMDFILYHYPKYACCLLLLIIMSFCNW
jgi:hypothetical protein